MLVKSLIFFFEQKINRSVHIKDYLLNVYRQNKKFKLIGLRNKCLRYGVLLDSRVGSILVPYGDLSVPEVIRELENEGEYEIGLIHSEDTVLDLGANFGYFSRQLSSICKAVYAFEPNPYVFNFLRQNLALPLYNGPAKLFAHNEGISDRTGFIEAAFKFHGTAAGSTVFLSGENKLHQQWRMLSPKDLKMKLGKIRFDVIKFDCEGTEVDVFCNAGFIEYFSPRIIFIEFHGGVAKDYLIEHLKLNGYMTTVSQKKFSNNGVITAQKL